MEADTRNILLIDDEADILRVLSMSLRADGYEVATAESGEEGIAQCLQLQPDIVITDIKMPGMDGIEVLKEVKRLSDETEVIIVTGHGDIDLAIEALQFGASDFINKPVRDEALSIALKRAQEKLTIKRQLKEYTQGLETKIAAATREIRRRSDFQARLIRSSNDGIVATDRDHKVVIFNPGAERIFGYKASELLNREYIQALFPEELAAVFEQGANDQNHKQDFAWRETYVESKQGERIPVQFSGAILHEKGRAIGSVAFFMDMREIKRLQQELVESEKLAAVGQTVAGLAHCIKNILHGLEGGSYIVDSALAKEDLGKLKSGWEMIQRNIGHTSDLVMDLLYYAKERQPEFKECRPNQIGNEVCDLLQAKADQNDIRIIRDFDDAVGLVWMDPQTIYRSLLNLMTNAIDACLMDENEAKAWQVTMSTRLAPDGQIIFTIEDNGQGMNATVRSQLFTSFFSTKGAKGTGLGLLVTRKLVEEHGGLIGVESTEGQGTTFTLKLPTGKSTPSAKTEEK